MESIKKTTESLMTLEQYPDVLTVSDMATILRINKSTAYHLLKNGIIPHRRIGTAYRISKNALISFIENAA